MAIRNIFSKGFKNTSLFEVSLVEDITPDLPSYAERFFMFFKMSPQIDGKFSPKENSISLKVSLEKAMAFATSLKYTSLDQKIGAFSIYSDTSKSQHTNGQSETKSCSVSQFTSNVKTKNGEIQQRKISISINSSKLQKPLGIAIFPEEGMAISRYIEIIAEKGIEKEFQFKSNNTPQITNNSTQRMDVPDQFDNTPFVD